MNNDKLLLCFCTILILLILFCIKDKNNLKYEGFFQNQPPPTNKTPTQSQSPDQNQNQSQTPQTNKTPTPSSDQKSDSDQNQSPGQNQSPEKSLSPQTKNEKIKIIIETIKNAKLRTPIKNLVVQTTDHNEEYITKVFKLDDYKESHLNKTNLKNIINDPDNKEFLNTMIFNSNMWNIMFLISVILIFLLFASLGLSYLIKDTVLTEVVLIGFYFILFFIFNVAPYQALSLKYSNINQDVIEKIYSDSDSEDHFRILKDNKHIFRSKLLCILTSILTIPLMICLLIFHLEYLVKLLEGPLGIK